MSPPPGAIEDTQTDECIAAALAVLDIERARWGLPPAGPPEEPLLVVPGLVARRYPTQCPAWGDVRWRPFHDSGEERRLLYCWTREAARLALLSLAPHGWDEPHRMTQSTFARALLEACEIEGVTLAS